MLKLISMKLVKWDFGFLAIIFLANLVLKSFRLGSPAQAYFDEGVYYIPAVREYLSGNFAANFEHPPLAKLFMSASVFIFGDNFWGWRLPEVLIGSLGVIFIYLLAKEMFPPKTHYSSSEHSESRSRSNKVLAWARTIISSRFIPILAAVFLTLEFSWFVNSRIATIEIYLATFSLAAAYFFWRFFKSESLKTLILTGAFFGLAIAAKWAGLLLIAFLMTFYIWSKRENLFPTVKKVILIGVIAVMVYLTSYSLYLSSHSLGDLSNLHVRMISYHLSDVQRRATEKTPEVGLLSSAYAPWTWVFNQAYPYVGEDRGDTARIILFFYNPALFWGILGILVFRFKRIIKDSQELFLAGAFLSFWLPWLFAPRYTFPYYLLPALPFGIVLLSKFISDNYQRNKYLVLGFITSVILLFLFYYPLLSYASIPTWYLRLLTGAMGVE